jgi:hypothetical protein
MPDLVVNGAVITCSFGTTPGSLTVIRPTSQGVSQPLATIMDSAPNVNIAPFGMCMTPSNPQVASATAAAQGVLTPQPCMPVTTAPWTPGSATVMVENNPALTSASTCLCMWGGSITITQAGQATVSAGS